VITGIILAGGKGSRLGREKSLLNVGEKQLINRVIAAIQQVCQEILIVTSKEQYTNLAAAKLDASIVVDLFPGRAALGGIYTGLNTAKTFHSLVVACDMPLLNSKLLSYIADIAPGFDIVIPKLGTQLETLHAVYSKNCLEYIKRLIDSNNLQIFEFFNSVKIRHVGEDEINRYDPHHLSFLNINTIEDLENAEKLIGAKPSMIRQE
jgi:molybdopterin-guanine dinucleotide biosynthesis protein A